MKVLRKNKIKIIIFMIFISCKKEVSKDILVNDYFSIPTDSSIWNNYEELRINDSIIRVSGDFSNYNIVGYINKKGQKINWWNVLSLDNKKLNIEYHIIDDIEKVNQYIFIDNDVIDNTRSKFYKKKKINENIHRIIFYTPNNFLKYEQEGNINYYLFYKGEDIGKFINIKCNMEENYYYVDIEHNNRYDKIDILGIFFEMYKDNNGNLVENEIYLKDVLE